MEKVHFIVNGRMPAGKKFKHVVQSFTTDHKRAKTEFKQLVNSLAQIGIVNQIEDRESPFNGMLVDCVMVARFGDDEFLDEIEWEDEDE